MQCGRVHHEAFRPAKGGEGLGLKTKTSTQHLSIVSCTQLMDDRQKWPNTKLLDPSAHPNNRDMPYTYQATNDWPLAILTVDPVNVQQLNLYRWLSANQRT